MYWGMRMRTEPLIACQFSKQFQENDLPNKKATCTYHSLKENQELAPYFFCKGSISAHGTLE